MSIEKDIHFIAKSIEWQNKLLAKLLSMNNTGDGSNECERRDDEGRGNKPATD